MFVVGSLVRSTSPPPGLPADTAQGPLPEQLGGGVYVQVCSALMSVHWPVNVHPMMAGSYTH